MIEDISAELNHDCNATNIDASLQILIALRFFCNRKFPTCYRVSISSVYRIIHTESRAIATRKEGFIIFRLNSVYLEVNAGFHKIALFTNVLVAIYGSDSVGDSNQFGI